MICVSVNQQGFLKVTGQDLEACNSYVLVSKSDYDYWFEYISVSPADASLAIGFGVSVILVLGFLSSYPIKLALNVIRKL